MSDYAFWENVKLFFVCVPLALIIFVIFVAASASDSIARGIPRDNDDEI